MKNPAQTDPHTVLILGKNKVARTALCQACHREGARGIPFSSLSELVEGFPNHQASLVLVDLKSRIEREDAIEALRFLGDRGYCGRVAILSGLPSNMVQAIADLGTSVGLNMFAPLRKPVSSDEISKLLHVPPEASAPTRKNTDRGEEMASHDFFAAGLRFYMQPLVCLKSGALAGVEALARFRSLDGELIGPNRFIPMLERERRLSEVTDAVLKTAVQFAAEHQIAVSINIGKQDLRSPGFAEKVLRIAENARIPSNLLTLEVTEREAGQLGELCLENALRLRTAGVGLSMDDFSMGNSSLLRLQQIPFSEIKLDRKLVARVADHRVARLAISVAFSLAEELKMSVVAEGIEKAADAKWLAQIGIARGQGWLFGRPEPIDEFLSTNSQRHPEPFTSLVPGG